MENNLSNRKAGRPSAAELAARPPAQPIERARVGRIVYDDGFVCPACHQAQVPFVRKAHEGKRYLQCSACQVELVHDIASDTVQPLNAPRGHRGQP